MRAIASLVAALVALFGAAACQAKTQQPASVGPGTWRVATLGTMSVERATHQATLLVTGEVLISGGCAGTGCDSVHASAEIYDPGTRTFRPATSMATARAGHSAVVLPDGRVLVSGGWTGERATSSAEIYDPATARWMPAGEMTAARASHSAVSLPDGRVLITGGGAGGLGDLATAEVFDPDTSTFSAIGPMQTNHYLATALANGRVLLTGGQGAEGEILSAAEVFDPATGIFQPTGDMTVPRVKHAAVLLADGRVLVIGGSDTRGYRARFDSTEVYDPATGSFSPGPDLRWGRHKIRDAVAVLSSGTVLVAGGAARPEFLDPTELAFVPVEGELSGPQMFATATVLSDQEVLVLGGYDDQTRPTATAWLLRPGG